MKPKSAASHANDEMMMDAYKKAEVTTDPMDKLRLLCLARGTGGILENGRVFRRMDYNNLNLEELTGGIRDAGLELNKDQIDNLFKTLDTDGSGYISTGQFIHDLRPYMSDSRKKSVNNAFVKLDQAEDGVFTLDDLRRVYSVRSHPLYINGDVTKDEILRKFIANFEKGCVNGEITEEEFLNYYSAISASVDTDVYFDLMIRQAYKL